MAQDFNIEDIITNDDISTLAKMLKEATNDATYEATELSWLQLKNSAKNFLKASEQLTNNYYNYEKSVWKSLINNNSDSNFIQGMRGSKEAYFQRAQYLLAFSFDAKLTAYLQELPKKALYVYTDSTGAVSTYELSMAELAKYANKHGRLNISANQLNKRGEMPLEKTGLFDTHHIAAAQAAYKGTAARLNQFYKKAGLSGGKAQGGLLMWKLSGEWNIARVTNFGDIKEAYTSALMTKHKSDLDKLCNTDIGSPKFYSHELISTFFNNYIYNVTNKAAIVEEDVITQQVQYSVKSARSELPTLSQYISVAELIVKSKSLLSQSELKKLINEKFPYDIHRNKVLLHGERITQKAMDKLKLSDLEKEMIIKIRPTLR